MSTNPKRTWFATLWPQSIRNLGIEPDFSDPEALARKLHDKISEISHAFYGSVCYKAQKDAPDAGYHCHVSVTLPAPVRLKMAATMLGNAHMETQWGTKAEACDYIEKRGDKFQDKGEDILAYFGDRDKASDNSGKRFNPGTVDIEIQSGRLNASNLAEYIRQNACTEADAREIEARFRRVMAAQVISWRDVNVIYVEGETGSGKTRGVYSQFKDIFKASVDSKTAFPLDGYIGQDVLVLDELRPGVFKPSELFQLLDGYPLNVNIKGGRMPAMWHTVIISTAFPMSAWYTSNDEDTGTTDIMRKQFFRRIKHHFLAIDQTWIEFPTDIDKLEERQELNFEASQQEPDYWGPLSEFF